MSSDIGTKRETLSEMIQQNKKQCDRVYAVPIAFFYFLLMFTIFVNRIRSARIKNNLDNCLATNKIGQMIPKEDLSEEV